MKRVRRLNACEELILTDDRPAYPWCFCLRMSLSGRLHRSNFDSAVRSALQRHPLLCSRIARLGKRLYWERPDIMAPVLEWHSATVRLEDFRSGRIDLLTGVGIRLHVFQGAEGDEVLLQFHHAVCDGRGMLTFVEDLLSGYANAKTGRSGVPGSVADFYTTVRVLPVVPHLLQGIRQAWLTIRRLPTPLCSHEAAPDESEYTAPGLVTETLSRKATSELIASAKELRVTVNDILVTSALLAVDDWRKKNGFSRKNWIRLLVPVDMRLPDHQASSARNIVSGVFLDRLMSELPPPIALLSEVHQEIRRSLALRFPQMFLLAIELCRFLPGGLRKHLFAKKCLVSLFVTNLGRLFERLPLPRVEGRIVVGDVVVTDVEIMPPLRPYTCANFLAATYSDALSVTMHFDARVMSEKQGQELLRSLLSRLSSWSSNRRAAHQDPAPVVPEVALTDY